MNVAQTWIKKTIRGCDIFIATGNKKTRHGGGYIQTAAEFCRNARVSRFCGLPALHSYFDSGAEPRCHNSITGVAMKIVEYEPAMIPMNSATAKS